MTQNQTARASYTRLPISSTYYDANGIARELQNIQRALPPTGVRTVTANYTAKVTDQVILCNPTSNAITVTLYAPSRVLNQMVTIKQITSAANAVTIGATVDGTPSPTLGGINKAITVISDGAAWYKIGAV